MKKCFFLVPFLSVGLLSSCTIFDLFTSTHKEAKADDLSSLKYAYMYEPSSGMNDYTLAKLSEAQLPYRTIGDVPYITVANMLSLSIDERIRYSISGDIYTYKIEDYVGGDITITVDSSNDTITFSDYDVFSSAVCQFGVVNNISSLVGGSNVKYTECEYATGGETVFDLKSHSLDVIAYDSDVYVPFAVANELSFAAMGRNFIYNGDAFFYVDSECFYKPNGLTLSTYGKSYYNGSLGLKSRSSAFASFNYNMLCFSFDYFYGFADKEYTSLDTYLLNNYRSIRTSLLSTDNDTYQQALGTFFYGIFYDGHTGIYGYSSIFGSGKFNVSTSFVTDRYTTLSNAQEEFEALRQEYLGRSPASIRYSSKTAIITFDSFESVYKDLSSSTIFNYKDSDSFAYFYNAFRTIKNKGGIENVVIDVSLNGGGAVDALIETLGFLTNDVRVNLYDPLTGSKTNLGYAVDANLDGKINSNDIQSSYNIYVLTSPCSFSCANLFASVCKENNLATIIGETSGGGACIVRAGSTADGVSFQMSGTMRLSTVSNGTYTDIDDGVVPDHTLDRDSFYNDAKLASFVESL